MDDNKETILIVDDIPVNLQLLTDVLQTHYEVRVANNGRFAFIALEHAHPDLILLDVMMPDIDGFEICRRLQANPATRHIPIIFMTALDTSKDEKKGFELGAVDYITKPFHPEIVLARVKTHLSLVKSRQLAEENERRHKAVLAQQALILDNAVLGITYVEERIFKQVNRRMEEIFGYDLGEMDGLATRAIYDTEETYRLVGEQAYTHLQKKKRYSGEWRFQRKDGSLFWGSLEGQALSSDNIHGGSIWLFRDITRRKEMADKLQESQSLFRGAFHKAGVGMALVKVDGLKFVEINQALTDLLGYTANELASMTVSDITYPEDLTVGLPEIKEVLAGKRDSLQVEKRYIHKFGQIIDVVLSATIVRDDQQTPLYFISHYQNITERKQAELETRQANAELSARLKELSALNIISQTLSTVHDLETTLETVAEMMTTTFKARGTAIGLLDETKTVVKIAAHFFYESSSMAPANQDTLVGLTLPLIEHPIIVQTITSKKVFIISNPATNPISQSVHPLMLARGVEALMCVPLQSRNTIIGLMFVGINDKDRTFTSVEISFAETIAGHIAGAIDNAYLFGEERRQRLMADSLRHVAMILNSTLNQDEILKKIMEELRHVIAYDSAGLFLVEEDSLVLSAISMLSAERFIGRRISLDSDNVTIKVFKSDPPQPIVLKDVLTSSDWDVWTDEAEIRSWMGVLMMVGHKKIGVLTADSCTVNFYDENSAQLLQTFANQAAIAIHNAQLYQETQNMNQRLQELNQKMQDELTMAKQIQQSLLPSANPEWSDIEVVCFSSTAREVGGDLYTYYRFEPSDNPDLPHYGIAVGDVSGKGTPAALMMSVTLASFQSIISLQYRPQKLLNRLDHILTHYTNNTNQNCAFVYTDIIPLADNTYRFRVANGGCISPLIKRGNGSLEWLDIGGLPLGIGLGSQIGYDELDVILHPDDMMILTSDGVVEAYNNSGAMLGFEGLETLVSAGPSDSAAEMLLHLQFEVVAYMGDCDARDDFTIGVIKV